MRAVRSRRPLHPAARTQESRIRGSPTRIRSNSLAIVFSGFSGHAEWSGSLPSLQSVAILTAARSRALRDLLFKRTSFADGRMADEVNIFADGFFPQAQTGSLGGQVHPFALSARNRFVLRSSME